MRTILIGILMALLLFTALNPTSFAHHQISYLAPADGKIVAFIGSGHHLPLGEFFPGLDRYSAITLCFPSGKRLSPDKAADMGAFGFAILPAHEEGLHLLGVAAKEHFGTRTTTGYFQGTRQQALDAGRRVIDSKQTFRFSKSYRWTGEKKAVNKTPMALGHRIEIVPDSLYNPLRQGGRVTATVMFDGKPLSGAEVGVSSVGRGGELGHIDEKEHFLSVLTADESGRVELPLIEKGWMVFMTEVTHPKPLPGVDNRYISTTLSLWVE